MGKSKDATIDGGSDDVKKPAPVDFEEKDSQEDNPVFDRQAQMDEIITRRNKEFAEETGNEIYKTLDKGEDETAAADDGEKPEAPKEEAEAAPPDEQPAPEPGKKVKLVVDGEEVDADLDAVIDAGKRTLQKETKAERVLQEVTELKKQLEAQLMAHPPVVEPPPRPQEDIATLKSAIDKARAEHIKAINYGEEADVEIAAKGYEAAVEAYNDAKYSRQPVVNKDEIVNEVFTRSKYMGIQMRLSQPQESGGYPEIYHNPYLRLWAAEIVNDYIAKGSPDDWETYRMACDTVREQLGWKTAAPVGGNSGDKGGAAAPTYTEKVKRKELIDNLESAGGRQEPPREKEESVSDTIRAMRRNRIGQ